MQPKHTSFRLRRVAPMLFLWMMLAALLLPGWADPVALPADLLNREESLAVEASTNRYPDADTVLLAGLQRQRYAPDGTYSQWHEEYVKILTEKGRRDHLTLSSHFVIPYQRGPEDCQIVAVNLIKPDGRVVPIDVAGQSRIMINPDSMADNIYNPNEKLIALNVGGLEVGDVLHFVMFDRIVQPRMAGSWGDWFVLESTRPIVRQVVEVEAPAERPLARMALKDPVGDTVRYTREERPDGGVLHRWEARDVPQVFPEPNMPPLHTVVQRVLVSTESDWESVSRWYWNLSLPRFTLTPEIEAKVAALTDGVKNPELRLRALFSFVAQEIRYMGIIAESEAPGYEPHDVGATFAARHGVCRDKAALLAVMLRAAGFDAYPTLIHNGPKNDPEVPQPFFNHAIVAVRQGEDWRLMDPTDETTRELMPSYLDDRSYLVATPEGDVLRTSPIAPATDNLVRIETLGTLGADGRLRAETTLEFDGINDNAYRAYFAQLQPQERQRMLEGAVRAAVPGARIESVELLPVNLMDVSTGLSARIAYSAEDVLLQGGGLAMTPLPLLGTRVGLVNFILGQTGLQTRRFPLKTAAACGIRERVLLELDPVFNTPESLPVSSPLNTGGVFWALQVHQHGPMLDAQAECRLDVAEFSPEAYQSLKSLRVEVERALRKMPIYAVPPGAAAGDTDAVIEDEQVLHEWLPDGTARETRSVRKRILTYAGKKQHSELVIRFNPAWDAVELVRGVVTTADGRTVEISPPEINVMDAEWVGNAPRYPPGRTLVASFPAVDVGAEIAYTVVVTRRDRPFFSCREVFGGAEAIRKKRLEIRAPDGQPLQVHRHRFAHAGIDEAIFTGGEGADSYAWSASGLRATRREEQMPPDWLLHPTVSVSSGNWGAYGRALHGALERAASRQPLCMAEGRRHRRSAGVSATERVRAIRDRVMTGVRLAGPTLAELPLSAITPADRTLQEGYGTVADRAVVLAAMLRAAGFTAEFVAVSRRPALDVFRESLDAVAEPEVFTDVLVRVSGRDLDIPSGRHLYLGEGDQYGSLGASAFEGMWALTLPRGEPVPLLPAHEDGLWTEHMLEVDAAGQVVLTQRSLFFGTAFGSEHRRYAEMTPEEGRRQHEELIAGLSQGARARGGPLVDFSDYPGKVEFTVELPDYAVRDGAFLYLRLPESIESLLRLRSDRRVQPLYMDGRGVWKSRCVVALPPGFETVMLPADRQLTGLAGLGVELRTSEAQTPAGTRVTLQREVSRQPAIVPPADYARLVEWDRLLGHPQSRTLVLRETAP